MLAERGENLCEFGSASSLVQSVTASHGPVLQMGDTSHPVGDASHPVAELSSRTHPAWPPGLKKKTPLHPWEQGHIAPVPPLLPPALSPWGCPQTCIVRVLGGPQRGHAGLCSARGAWAVPQQKGMFFSRRREGSLSCRGQLS